MTPAVRNAVILSRPYTSEARAYFAAMTVQPTPARKALIHALIVSLKAAGVWSTLDLFYLLAAHSAQAARINARSPGTFNCSAVNSPTFTADRGYAGDGASSYLETGWAPSAGVSYLQNNATLGVWDRTNGQISAATLGSGTGAADLLTARNGSDKFNWFINGSGSVNTIASANSIGFWSASRTGASATTGYKNGSSVGTGASASSARSSVTLNIGRFNTSTFHSHQISVALAGGALADSQHLALYNAIQTYMTAVGA